MESAVTKNSIKPNMVITVTAGGSKVNILTPHNYDVTTSLVVNNLVVLGFI